MTRKTEQILINGCVAALGALSIAIKGVEWGYALWEYKTKGKTL